MPNFEGYDKLEKIAEGKDRAVYTALRVIDNTPVILKTLRSEHPNVDMIALMYHEYELARNIHYDGIIKTYDLIDANNQYALVQENMHGTSLHQHLQQNRITNLTQFLKLAIQMVKILGYLHQSHIIHKDIKPSNFIYDHTLNIIKLTDFNFSTKLEHETQDIVPPSKLEGTLAYMAPEQTGRMNMNIDYRADFYALGVTFYEMLTGTLPFKHTDPLEMLHAHLANPIPDVSNPDMEIPPVIKEIITKLMAKNPGDRYQSVIGLQTDLEYCLESLEKSGRIDAFPLGREDIQDRLIVSQKLYGREEETHILLKAYERVSQGGTETLMVCGFSGIGKTMLIDEVHKPMTKQKGYFIHGKFDQLLRDKPYTAITDALNQLARHILAEPEASFERLRKSITEALGSVGKIITDLAPDFELVIGPQLPLDELPPKETENRMKTYFKRFIRAVIDGDHTLVIFIDDLQWADSGSLNLLSDIMLDIEMHHLLLIGAYRDNEVDKGHPLKKMITMLEEQNNIRTLPLLPLRVDDFSAMLQDSLHCDATSVKDLAILIHQRTEGNPFFCKQILQLIYREGLLKFNYQQRRWDWNLSEIAALGITDNVVDLMLNKMANLPAETQSLLKYASCIGNQFTLDMLMLITNKSADIIGKGLWPALEQELLITPNAGYKRMDAMQKDNIIKLLSRDITYKFIHDRVQQAAYQSIPENEKALIHLDIAHIIVEKNPEAAKQERLFEVVDHFNHALHLLQGQERQVVAKLNYLAGIQAKTANAYKPMLNYLTTALKLIDVNTWNTDYQFAFEINRDYLLALFLLNQTVEAESLVQNLLMKAKSNLDKAEIYRIQIMNAVELENRDKVLDLSQQALRLFDIHLVLKPNPLQMMAKLLLTRWKMRKFLTGDFAEKIPIITAPEITIKFTLLAEAWFTLYEKSTESFVYTVLLAMELLLQHGRSKNAGLWLVGYAVVYLNVYKDAKTAIRYCDIAEKYFSEAPDAYYSSSSHLLMAAFVNHWSHPLSTSRKLIEQSYQEARESGNVVTSLFCLCSLSFTLAAEAKSINRPIEAMELASKMAATRNSVDMSATFELLALLYLNLKEDNKKSDRLIRLEQLASSFESLLMYETSHKYLSFYYYCKEDDDKSIEYYFKWDKDEEKIRYELFTAEVKTINALTLMRQLPKINSSHKRKYKKHIKKLMRDVEWAAKSAPMNYLHHFLFLLGYEEQAKHNYMQALTHYKIAVENARKSDFTLWVALGHELIGDLCMEAGQDNFGNYSYRDAYYYYKRYGMLSKANSLASRHPECVTIESRKLTESQHSSLSLSESASSGTSSASLDFMSVIKASQAISGEIILDKLFEKLLRVVFENAGATKAVLIESRKERLHESAALELIDGKVIFSMPNVDMNEIHNISHSIVRYTIRSRESVVYSKSNVDSRFNQDPYIINHQPKSVFCLPLLYQDSILGAVYLESNVTEGAFVEDRITVLNALASQIAVSIQNARHFAVMTNLYHSTERFVPKAFLELLNKKTIEDIKVGDSTVVNLAPMFADIRNFTTISEAIGVDRTAELLNAYMKQMSPIIRRHNGFVSQFLGDGIMALFPGHYTDALNAALEMRASLPEFNAAMQAKGYEPIETGIGINAGPAMLITLGEEERLDASVISDVVNSAARIEGLNKIYGTGLLISDAVYNAISDRSKYLIRVVDKVRVKGRKQAMYVYEVRIKDNDSSGMTQAYFDEFNAGFKAYETNDFATAEKLFQNCLAKYPDDKLAKIFKDRCEEFIKSGIPAGWDGTYTALEK